MEDAIKKTAPDDTLKLIAMVTMLIDHIGYLFFPDQIAWRMVGRLSFPIFAFLTARGVRLTRSKPRYLLRMLLYGGISQLPYQYFVPHGLNIFFTLAAGLVLILCVSHPKLPVKLLALPVLGSAWFLDYSYGLYGLLIILAFHVFYHQPLWMIAALSGLSWYYWSETGVTLQALALAALPLIYANPRFGLRLPKHLGYLFYPGHITLLLLIQSALS